VLIVHVWLVSAGHWTTWPTYSSRYDLLASAFAAGQADLTVPVDPDLLKLPDPYDPIANKPFRSKPGVHDACLFNGRLYYYWGPGPALLLAPIKWLAGRNTTLADQYLCFAFAQGVVLISGLMLLRLRSMHVPQMPAWLPAAGILLAGLSTPITCIMTRAAVYEVAILGGQFFLLAGIYASWRALASEASEVTWPFVGGACLAAAVACRVSLAVAVLAIGVLVLALMLRKSHRGLARSARRVFSFGLPLAVTAIALCLYNHARFGSPLDFGQKYQLAGANLRALPSLFGIDNLWPNLWSYFVRPFAGTSQFPFILAVPGDDTFPRFIRIPHGYEIYEPITGLIWVMPIFWLLPIGWLAVRRSAKSRQTVQPTGERPVALLVTMLLLAAVLGFVPVLLMIGSSQRYLADLTPSLIVIATLAAAALIADAATPRKAARRHAFVATLTVLTCVVGVLIGIEGYSRQFRFHNPSFYRSLGADVPAFNPDLQQDLRHEKH